MRGIFVRTVGKTYELEWKDFGAERLPDEHEVQIDVRAAGVNRADLLQARGLYPPPPGASSLLGLEVSGTVHAVGPKVTRCTPGDRVCALLDGGGYAERVVSDERLVLKVPESLSFVEAAAIPEAWITAHLNLFIEGHLHPGETVLIHSGASGVGSAALQLAVLANARVFATAGTDEKCRECERLGAEAAISYKTSDFVEEVKRRSSEEGIDLILDTVGGPYLERNIQLLCRRGRLVIIGLLGGSSGTADVNRILKNNLRIAGSTLRDRSHDEKAQIVKDFEQRFWAEFSSGKLKPVVDSVFPIARAADAHAHMKQNLNTGKIILEVAQP